jgi:peptidoglycan hydrolase-like protein with peptidoglycan-binding domain
VQAVQRRLGIKATGRYGVATRHAVRHYQRSLGWSGSGVVGQKTWHRLF